MLDTARALYTFWSGFGLPAYTVDTVPHDAAMPYITYSLVETEPLETASHYAQVWYRTQHFGDLLATVDAIKAKLTDGTQGARIDCPEGYVCIRPASPLVQILTDADPSVKYAYINLQINCYHN